MCHGAKQDPQALQERRGTGYFFLQIVYLFNVFVLLNIERQDGNFKDGGVCACVCEGVINVCVHACVHGNISVRACMRVHERMCVGVGVHV